MINKDRILQRATSDFLQRATSTTSNKRILQRATSARSNKGILQRVTSDFIISNEQRVNFSE